MRIRRDKWIQERHGRRTYHAEGLARDARGRHRPERGHGNQEDGEDGEDRLHLGVGEGKGDQVGGQTGWLCTARSLEVPWSHGEVVVQDLAHRGTRAHDVRLDTLKELNCERNEFFYFNDDRALAISLVDLLTPISPLEGEKLLPLRWSPSKINKKQSGAGQRSLHSLRLLPPP